MAPDARAELALATSRYPFLSEVCRLAGYDRDIAGLVGLDHVTAEGYDRIYLCAPDEIGGLRFALDTPALWRGTRSIVFVPVYRQAALAAAFHGDARHDLLDEVHGKLRLYPVLTHACDAGLIAEDLTERLAQQIHLRYLYAQQRAGLRLGDAPAMVPWSRLPESLRRANRSHVQDIAAKLLNLGCVVAPRHGGAGDASAAGRPSTTGSSNWPGWNTNGGAGNGAPRAGRSASRATTPGADTTCCGRGTNCRRPRRSRTGRRSGRCPTCCPTADSS